MAFPAYSTADGVDLGMMSDVDAARYVWGVYRQPECGKFFSSKRVWK